MELKTKYYQEILEDFDTHIISTKSLKTGNHYRGEAMEFLEYLENNKIRTLNNVDDRVMKNYFNYLIQRPKKRGEGTLSIRTINDHLSTLRMLSNRMLKEQRLQRSLLVPKNVREEKNENNPFVLTREVLTTEETKQVYEACENNLERCIIALAYGCGLRRGSLEALLDLQINYTKGIVTAEKTKNNKTLEIPISRFFLKVLRDYSIERLQILAKYNKRELRFFIDDYGSAIGGSRLNDLLKQIIKRTNNPEIIDKKITLHCLRHSIATHLIDAGETYDYVKNFLGHSFIDTTSIYAKRRKIKNNYAI